MAEILRIDFVAITAAYNWEPSVALMPVRATEGDLAAGDTSVGSGPSSLLDELEAPLLDFLINLHMGSVKAPVCNRTVALHRPQMRGQVVLLGATKSLSHSGFFERLRVCQFLHA